MKEAWTKSALQLKWITKFMKFEIHFQESFENMNIQVSQLKFNLHSITHCSTNCLDQGQGFT